MLHVTDITNVLVIPSLPRVAELIKPQQRMLALQGPELRRHSVCHAAQ
jgi:hypothetical protein